MKRFTTFLLFSIFALSVYAYDPQTILSISSFSNYSLRIVVDNNDYYLSKSRKNADLILSDLRAGSHHIQIYHVAERASHGGFEYVIYEANIYLRAGYFTDIFVNRFDNVFVDEMPQEKVDKPNPEQLQIPYTRINAQISTENFETLKATLRNEAFDNSRLNIAKQAAAANFFSAPQVKELMQLFSYDESRLDIAKTFYPRVTDKQNYFMVNDAFSFSSSKEALAEFIRQNP